MPKALPVVLGALGALGIAALSAVAVGTAVSNNNANKKRAKQQQSSPEKPIVAAPARHSPPRPAPSTWLIISHGTPSPPGTLIDFLQSQGQTVVVARVDWQATNLPIFAPSLDEDAPLASQVAAAQAMLPPAPSSAGSFRCSAPGSTASEGTFSTNCDAPEPSPAEIALSPVPLPLACAPPADTDTPAPPLGSQRMGILSDYAGVVILGGYMGAYEGATFPAIRYELALIRAAIESNMPVLGICLGAQLIAHATGGRAYESPRAPEAGTVSLAHPATVPAGHRLAYAAAAAVGGESGCGMDEGGVHPVFRGLVFPPSASSLAGNGGSAGLATSFISAYHVPSPPSNPHASSLSSSTSSSSSSVAVAEVEGHCAPSSGTFVSHHGDTFTIPPHAVLLAVTGTCNGVPPSSSLCASADSAASGYTSAAEDWYPQAFCFPDNSCAPTPTGSAAAAAATARDGSARPPRARVLGVQFHPEALRSQFPEWAQRDAVKGKGNKYVDTAEVFFANRLPEETEGQTACAVVGGEEEDGCDEGVSGNSRTPTTKAPARSSSPVAEGEASGNECESEGEGEGMVCVSPPGGSSSALAASTDDSKDRELAIVRLGRLVSGQDTWSRIDASNQRFWRQWWAWVCDR